MEIAALIISIFAAAFSIYEFAIDIRRARKQATLDAFNILQEQAFDEINKYSKKDIEDIAEQKESDQYKQLTVYLARIEHFSVGVNTRIYDRTVVKRLAGKYLIGLDGKLSVLIDKKRKEGHSKELYDEFKTLVISLKKTIKKEKPHV